MVVRRDLLKQIIADQMEFRPPKVFFDRAEARKIRGLIDDPSIIILSGIRRSGKSTIQRVFQKELFPSDYYFNFDDERLINFAVEDFQTLLETFIELFGLQTTFYFDEIQNVRGWERFVRRLYDKGHKIFITGSNANLLSRELGTHLTGRYMQFEIYPLSFGEITKHELPSISEKKALSSEDKGEMLRLFATYVQHGGIPEYFTFRNSEYVKDLYEGILYRDIVVRRHLSDEKGLKGLVHYFASNVGKEFSYAKLSETFGFASANTIAKYCVYLEECYLCFFLSRYSHSLKKQIQYNKKCYLIDPALIQAVGFRVSNDFGRLLENIVFVELKRRGSEIYFHKGQKECDFVIRENNQIIQAIQVTTSLMDLKVREREINGLLEAMQEYELSEGVIVTESEEERITIEAFTITVIPIWKWLISLS